MGSCQHLLVLSLLSSLSLMLMVPLPVSSSAAATLPRGLPLSKKAFYRADQPFTCLDGAGQLAWAKVNDDYCDCADGSDEPGTSACPNSFFYCPNRDYRAKFLPSSRVDDGICDCCDGSDEYRPSATPCANTCWEQGRVAREEAERQQRSHQEGAKIRAEYLASVEGQLKEKRQRLDSLAVEIAALAEKRSAAETAKSAAEAPEKEALDRHRTAWEAAKEMAKAARDATRLAAAFKELDANKDDRVDASELQRHLELDTDGNGEVGVDEARVYLLGDAATAANASGEAPAAAAPSVAAPDAASNVAPAIGEDGADEVQFRELVWPRIRDLYKVPAPEPVEDEGAGEDQEVASTPSPDDAVAPVAADEEPKEPAHDAATQMLVTAAEEARKAFQEVDEQHRSLETEQKELETLLAGSYGPDNAYLQLAVGGACFEFTDREYTYKMCPFREITQLRKDGGGSTSLGHWGQWQEEHRVMLFEKGEACWNGPARSTKVQLHCGPQNELRSAAEPSRCEYVMDFNTPAACGGQADGAGAGGGSPEEAHDEL